MCVLKMHIGNLTYRFMLVMVSYSQYPINIVTSIIQYIKIVQIVKFSQSTGWLVWVAATITEQQQSLGSKLHTDVVLTDVHTDVVLADVQVYFGLIRSCDHNEDDVHMWVSVKMATRLKILVFASFFSQIFLKYAIYVTNRWF